MLNKKIFQRINLITLGSVFVLILVGSIVRSMGAGMGCPDWPKCFGYYIPPSTTEELPDNYLDIFRSERLRKNERLAGLLSKLGYKSLAHKVTNDPYVKEEHAFDFQKAWIEYINRLVGVLIGFFVFFNMIWSFSYWKENKYIPVAGVAIFILTGFQGWIGALVVSTNLLKGFITFHMLLALLIVALLIWMYVRAKNMMKVVDKRLYILSVALFLMFIPQIILGTEVRSIVDHLLIAEPDRSLWNGFLSSSFFIHRSYSWLILIGSIMIFILVRKNGYKVLNYPSLLLLAMVVAIGIAGVLLVNFSFPFWVQPLHLILATGIFSTLFYLTLRFKLA